MRRVVARKGVVLRTLSLLAVLVVAAAQGTPARPAAARVAATNPIVLENQQPGTTSWQFTDYNKADNHEIEGYASLTSVNKGDSIDFMVSLSSSAQFTMEVYRMGWYPTGTNPDGTSCAPSCGGRLMQTIGPLNGFKQATCPRVTSSTDPNFGLTECNWTPSYTLAIPTSWTTGNYIVKLKRLDGTRLENYMTFVVRDDASTAPVVYSLDVNTWQAYNFWGGSGNGNVGINLYGRFNDVTLGTVTGSRAYTVSFDRPYLVQGSSDGAGNFFVWDFPLVRWMESQGYDMTYVTDVDLEARPNFLNSHRVFVNTGHDEYYSDGMKTSIKNAIAAGVNMAFFSANNIYFRVTWDGNESGRQYRRIHCDKGALTGLTTVEFRNLQPPQPENAVTGVLQNGVATARPYLVYDASHWIYAGTGLSTYSGSGTTNVITSGPGQNALPGLVGYEFDTRAGNASGISQFTSYEPAGVQQVGHSFVPASDNGVSAWADAVIYTAPSGASVFSAGTIQWPYGLDNGFANGFCDCDHNVANAAAKKTTANILDRFIAPRTPTPTASLSTSSLTFVAQNVGTTSAAQNVTLTNIGTAPMTITSIAVTGTNAADFAQTNTCPGTLAINASCTISVTFTPSAAGARSAAVTLNDDAFDNPQTITLSGTGVVPTPAVTLTPTSLSFGSVNVGTTSTAQTVTLRNSGTAPLAITSVGLAGTNPGDYTQTNTCPVSPSTLAVNATCTISVSFRPTINGSRPATVSIVDNAPTSPQSVALSGTGVAPNVSLSATSLTFAQRAVGTTSAAKNSTLRNTGNAPLTITSISIGGTNPTDFAQTNTCPIAPSTLAAGGSCVISVTFTPRASGSRTGNVTIVDNAASSPQTIALSGTGSGAAPAVTFSPTSLAFGSQRVGTASTAQTTTLTNSGTAALTITSVSLAGTSPGDYSRTTTCPLSPSTLAAGASCTISVTFLPTATGARNATVSVADNASGSPHTVALSGTGTAPAVGLSPTSLTYAARLVGTTSAAQTVTLSNTGSAPLAITSVSFTGTNAGDFSRTTTCPVAPATLAAGGSCSIDVTFTPSAAGARSASLSVADDAAGSPHTVGLSGTGTAAAPAVTLAPVSLGFGSQRVGTTSASQTSTLSNTGTAPLTISSLAVTGTAASDFAQTSTCPLAPATLAAGGSCSIAVTFTPTASGARAASVTVTDDAAGSPHVVSLSGTGTAPAVTLAPASIAFASQLVGTSSSARTTTLTNTGNAPLAISAVTVTGAHAGDFSATNGCGVTLAATASCTISVVFTPSAAGARTATLSVADDAAGSPHTVSLSGTGGDPAPAATLSPTTLTFASQLVGTTSASQSVTLRNSGSAPLAIASVVSTGDFAQTNDCPSSLAVDATCTLTVTFTPSAPGTRTGTVSVTDNAADSPQQVTLTGTGVAPAAAASLSRTTVAFGSQRVATTSAAQSVTLTSTGTKALAISSIVASGDYAQTNDCPASLAVGGSCTLSITFTPAATGARTGSVSIADDAPDTPQTISLTGTGTAPAVGLSPSTLTFGSQTVGSTSAGQATTLTNTGTAPLAIASITVSGANAGDFARTTTCPVGAGTLAAGASCTITVTFTPAATGARSATLVVTDDAAGSPHNVALSGTGSTGAAIALDGNLGTKVENLDGTTMTLTTTRAAAVGARILLFVHWTNASRTLVSASGGGLTWTVDNQVQDGSGFHGGIVSAPAPLGLAAGTVLTVTFSGIVTRGLIAAASFTGLAASSALDGVGSRTGAGATAWSAAVTTTNANDLVVSWSGIDANTTSTPTAPAAEIHDFGDPNYWGWSTSAYRIESTAGAKTIAGTWGSASGATATFTVAAAYRSG